MTISEGEIEGELEGAGAGAAETGEAPPFPSPPPVAAADEGEGEKCRTIDAASPEGFLLECLMTAIPSAASSASAS